MVENGERKKREMPERQKPDRGFANLLGQPVGINNTDSLQSKSDSNGSWSDNVDRGVNLGYKVIEDQILQGQRFAEKISKGSYDAGAMNKDMHELSRNIQSYWDESVSFYGKIIESVTSEMSGMNAKDSGSSNTVNQGVQGLVDSFARAFSTFSTAPTDQGTVKANSESSSMNVVCSVSSSRPVDININLQRSAPSLVVDRLYEHEIDKPPLTGITIEQEGAHQLRVKIQVSNEQPVGIYSGIIYNPGNKEHCGTLSVTVQE